MSFGHVFPKQHLKNMERLSLGVYDAVCSFNDGNVSKLKMLQKMGAEPGEFSVGAMKLLDRERLMKAIYAFSGRSKKIRKDKEEKERKKIILRKIRRNRWKSDRQTHIRNMAQEMGLVPKGLISRYFAETQPEVRIENNISSLLHEKETPDDIKS
ncbi:hypothetical protein TNCV_4898451 [Trichonephila clavipes]|nr:hypothetical protein TNCV_4898451 [Trichonephila clavipes]